MKNSWSRQPSNILLAFAFLVFFGSQIYITAGPMLSRASPVEVDDAYSYLIKAEEIRECAFQACPALEDLHAQFTAEAKNPDVGYLQIREYHRLFVVYQPLQSFGLVALSNIGLGYHTAYAVMAIAFKALMGIAIALWLRALFGNLGASAALLVLAPIVFVGTGIHTLVPGTMALAVALLLWGLIASGENRAALLLPLIVAAILLHDIGKVYAGMGLLAMLVLNPRPFTIAVRKTTVIGFLLVFGALAATFTIEQPEFRFDPTEFYPGHWDYATELVNSLEVSFRIVGLWLNSFGHAAITLTLLASGVVAIPKENRLKWATMFILLLGLIGLGTVYVAPWFGAFVFERAWVPMGVFLTATIAAGAMKAAVEVWRELRNRDTLHLSRLLSWSAVLVLFAWAMASYFPFYLRHYELTYNNQISRQNISFDSTQPARVFDSGKQTVVYTQEIPFYYYIVNGGLHHNAIYYPVAAEFPEFEDEILSADFVVSSNPIYGLSENPDLQIVMDDFSSLSVTRLDGQPIGVLHLSFETNASKLPVKLTWRGGDSELSELSILEGGQAVLSDPGTGATWVLIKLRTSSQMNIAALRFQEEITTNWPWQQGAYLEVTTSTGTVTSAEISQAGLVQELPSEIKVIDDDGYTVLAEVVK